MKKTLVIIAFMTAAYAKAQTEAHSNGDLSGDGMTQERPIAAEDAETVKAEPLSDDGEMPQAARYRNLSCDTISLPMPFAFGRPTLFSHWNSAFPMWGATNYWDVHEGLNGQIGAGVMFGFGKNNPFKGASFFNDVSLLYAKSLGERWTLAVGGTMSRFRMWDETMLTGSATVLANYKFNEHLNATLSASYHDTLNDKPYLPLMDKCAEIGADINYKFNNGVTVGIGYHQFIQTDSRRPWAPQNTMKPIQPYTP